MADDVGMDALSLLFQILSLEPKFLSVPILANLDAGSNQPRFSGG
jgi:hypothetical protein